MLFAIVYTGDHYVVDIIAGGILAVLCYGAAFYITKRDFAIKEPGSGSQAVEARGHARLLRALIGGGVILIVGIGVGSYNRQQFVRYPMAYNLYAPGMSISLEGKPSFNRIFKCNSISAATIS